MNRREAFIAIRSSCNNNSFVVPVERIAYILPSFGLVMRVRDAMTMLVLLR